MRRSRCLKAALVLSVAAAVAIVPLTAAFANIQGDLAVSPNTGIATSTATNFTITFTAHQGASANPSGDNAECLILTLTDFTAVTNQAGGALDHTAFTGPAGTSWNVSASGSVVTIAGASSTDQMFRDQTGTLLLKATSPSSPETANWTMTTWKDNGCSKNNSDFIASFSSGVVVGGTTTSVTCSPNPVNPGQATTCTVTVTGTSPTGTVDWSHTGTGSFSSTSCALSGGSCSVTYTISGTAGETITAHYQGDKNNTASSGSAGLGNTSSSGGGPGPGPSPGAPKDSTLTTLTCDTNTPTVGASDNCHATVKDVAGNPSPPTGTVGLSSTGSSSARGFASSSCTLVTVSGSSSTASCSSAYSASSTGSHTLTATYGGDTAHNGSTGTLGLDVKAAAGAPRHYQPDGLIRKPGIKFRGNNIYNGTGNHQTVGSSARRGQKRTFFVKVQNDGDALDSFFMSAPGQRPPGFRVRYFLGTTEITSAVANHTYMVAGLVPGGTRTFRVVIVVLRHAPLGTVRAWYVEIRSQHDPTRRDVVKIKISTPRH